MLDLSKGVVGAEGEALKIEVPFCQILLRRAFHNVGIVVYQAMVGWNR